MNRIANGSSPHEGGYDLYRRLLGYVFPHWRIFAVAAVAMAFVAGSETAFAALMKPLLDGSFIERDETMIRLAPIAIVGIFLVRAIAAFLAQYGMAWVARTVISALRSDMFHRLLQLPVRFFDDMPPGQLLSKLIYDVEQVARATTDSITVLIRDTLTVIGLLAWMFYIDWFLAMVLLVGAPLIAQLIAFVSRKLRRYSSRVQESVGNVADIAEEAIVGQRVVKSFGGQEYESRRFTDANDSNRRLNMKFEATNAASVPVIELIAAVAAAVVIYLASLQEDMTVGTFVSFVTAMMLMHSPMKRLTRVNAAIQRGIAAAESIFALIDTPPEKDKGTVMLDACEGEVEFKGVSFAYETGKRNVLEDINLHVRPGETVALVGRSGSGKSTLANLVPRFYEVGAGSIVVDGHDVREISLNSLRDQISLVTQHITLFNDTIGHNIAYGALEGVTEEDVVRAAEAAYAMDFIRELPDGLNTLVGENGVLLSGGQRQRLAIARALLKDAPILILDEATSALDTESERHIQAALERLVENRTTLVIAHRLSTIEKADRIVVLDGGRIVESGRHDELLARDGHYAFLHRLQFQDARPAAASA